MVAADALEWTPPAPFDAVLVDAPCSASGTIRRHPDLPHLRTGRELAPLLALQAALLDRAWGWLAPGGRLVYGVCSLLPAEGEAQVARFLAATPEARIVAPGPGGARHRARTGSTPWAGCGSARTSGRERGGMDGFYAACLAKPGDAA